MATWDMDPNDPLAQDIWEAAAARTRRAVKPAGGRDEGLLTAFGSLVPQALLQAAGKAVTFPRKYMDTYQPGQSVADDPSATDWAADTAMGMVGGGPLVGNVSKAGEVAMGIVPVDAARAFGLSW